MVALFILPVIIGLLLYTYALVVFRIWVYKNMYFDSDYVFILFFTLMYLSFSYVVTR